MSHDYRNDAKRSTERKRTDITHEYLCGISVEPQKSEPGTSQRAAENGELTRSGNVGNIQVRGEFEMACEVRNDAERARNHYGRQDGETIKAVSKVNRIAEAHDDEITEQDVNGSKVQGDVFKEGHKQLS